MGALEKLAALGDKVRELEAGGVWRIPPNVPHGVEVGSEGAVVFAPVRDDWRELERLGARSPAWP